MHEPHEAGARHRVRLGQSRAGFLCKRHTNLVRASPFTKDGVNLPFHYLLQAILRFIKQAFCDSLIFRSSFTIRQETGHLTDLYLIDDRKGLIVGLDRRWIDG